MLVSIYKGGSSVILPNPRDVDYFYYYESLEERHEAFRNATKDLTKDIHYRVWNKEPKIFLGCYSYPFMEHIEGLVNENYKTFNICDHKEEYIKITKKFFKYLPNENKQWYHIYIACMMFENGKNELTEAQKQKAQNVHDKGITSKQLDFIKRVLNY